MTKQPGPEPETQQVPAGPGTGAPATGQEPVGPGGQHSVAIPVRQPGPFKRGFGLGAGVGAGVAVALLTVGTILSLISFLSLLAAGVTNRTAGSSDATVTVWGPASAKAVLRAVDINGVILTDSSGGGLLASGTYGYEIARMIDRVEAEDAEGLVLRMNTPGGTITGAKAIADAVARYQQRTGNKVFAHVQGLSASGGMWAMAGADDIRADHGSNVGSIGVILGPFSRYRDVVAISGGALTGGVTTTGGIEEFYITRGRGKDAGNPFRDLTPEERAIFQQGVDNEYAAFVDHVATQRSIPAETVRDDLGAGLFDTRTAEEKGLIDGTMGIDEAYRHFATLAGLDPAQTRVVAASSPSLLASLLGAEQRVPGQALPVAVESGVRPVTAPLVCGSASGVLAYHGDPGSLCG